MIDVREICSLSDFQRHAKNCIKRLKSTRTPIVLTVNGKAGAVVLDPQGYQAMVDRLELAESVAAIRQGMKEFEEGKGIPWEVAEAQMRQELGIQARSLAKSKRRSQARVRLDDGKLVRQRRRRVV